MHYSKIKWVDVGNGTGVRLSLFVSGCPHHCPGCFNPETWDFSAGTPFTPEIQEEILDKLDRPHMKGLSLLGGEPLAPENQQTVLALVQAFHHRHPQKDIWCYTGYLLEDLLAGVVGNLAPQLLAQMDYLVDGLFVESLKNPSLAFRGSENQRIIHLPPTLAQGKAVVLEDQAFRG